MLQLKLLFTCVILINSTLVFGTKLEDIVNTAKKSKTALGIDKDLYPTKLNFYEENITVHLDEKTVKSGAENSTTNLNILTGTGINFKPSSDPLRFYVSLPKVDSNVCGILLGSGKGKQSNVEKIQVYWRPNKYVPWDILTVPNTGARSFTPNMTKAHDTRVIFTEPVPAHQLIINILPKANSSASVTLAVIHGCTYPKIVTVKDCNEKFIDIHQWTNKNHTFPMVLQCPKNCTTTPLCWGYKVYTVNSAICYTAKQAMGVHGELQYFVYPIKNVVYFRTQMNSLLTHGVYCRRSSQLSPGYSFNRYYYDFSMKEFNMHVQH